MGRAFAAAVVEEDAGGHPREESMGIQTAEADSVRGVQQGRSGRVFRGFREDRACEGEVDGFFPAQRGVRLFIPVNQLFRTDV
ncbi:MAG: hypothetical protein ACQESR_27595 [Planctomycetota bacterium]